MSNLLKTLALIMLAISTYITPSIAWSSGGEAHMLDLTSTGFAIAALIIFIFAYALVIGEEFLHLRKSKPVMLAAGFIWILVALAYAEHGDHSTPEQLIRHNILEYAELLLFLLAAMTYVNTLEERNVFAALRAVLVSKGFNLRTVFWITGLLAFFISPVADNLTTALVMAAVVMAVGTGNTTFITLGCINIVVAANAGGAFSPFGDITTLMVWQKGKVDFIEFFDLFIPSVINWLVPALIMSFFISKEQPAPLKDDARVKKGGFIIIAMFLGTIALAVGFHSFLHLPSMLGMMTGLGALKIYSYMLKRKLHKDYSGPLSVTAGNDQLPEEPLDTFHQLMRAEWDTLMFFYGVILCVGGLGALGYLDVSSHLLYEQLGATWANITIGLLSAVVDNIPVMFAVLSMDPHMSHGQWLLVTLTAGVGGSLLSVGSAAGVALMGQARGVYTFFSHLKWTWAVALGYIASILAHLYLNQSLFH